MKKLRELIFQRESCDDALSEGIDVENNQSKLVQINQEIKKGLTESKISMKSIYLGIRILADVPVWPLAMVFAEALKSRAKYIEKWLGLNDQAYRMLYDDITLWYLVRFYV